MRAGGVGILHVLRGVGEGGAVLGGRVLWTVRGNVAQHHHDRPVGIHPLGHAEVVDTVVGDDVCQVVLHGGQMEHVRVLTCIYHQNLHKDTETDILLLYFDI